MQNILDWFGDAGLSPHGFCLLWQPRLVALHVVSDAIVGASYYVIPFALAYFVRRRTDISFGWIFWMFGLFILACGTTHFFDMWVLWHPDYAAQGLVKAFTAVASLSTAVVIWPLLPRVLALPSVAQFRKVNTALAEEVAERDRTLEKLRQSEEHVRLLADELAHRLHDSEARLTILTDRLPNAAVYQMIVEGDRSHYAYVSKGIERIRGVSAGSVLADPMLLRRQVLPQYLPALEAADETARGNFTPFEHEFEVRLPNEEVRWMHLSSAPRRLPSGGIAWDGIQLDITERKRAEERQRLMTEEINHRARNLLAVVQSIIKLTRAKDIDSFVSIVTGRLMALARAHGLLSDSRWQGADLHRLVEEELEPYRADPDRVEINGPLTTLATTACQPVSMALHELATNAAKYGALSRPTGRLTVSWAVGSNGLVLSWQESGGPPIASPPILLGFGHTVLVGSIEKQLAGRVVLNWRPGGLQAEMTIPSAEVVTTTAEPVPAE